MDLMIHERRDEADGVVSLTLGRADGGELPAWAPGAHVDVTLADDLVRQYSLCSDPGDRQRWRLGVLREPESRGGSEHVFDKLHDGDIVEVGEPRNHFALEPAPRYVFVAGGIGITPILPMIAAAEAAGAEWTLLYGGRTRTSMAFRDELAAHGDRVVLAPQDEVGLLDLRGQLMAPRPEHARLRLRAGADARRAGHGDDGVARRQPPRRAVHAADDRADGADEAFEVAFAASGVTLVVPPDRSILDVAQDRGLPVDFSCGEGTCGTCETPLLAGRAEHRDSLLTDEEKDDQDTVFICVSRAERGCPRLELDL